MKIIKNILRRLNPMLVPAGAKKTPLVARERPRTGIPEADNCGNCYVCQAGISPDVTVPMFREAQAKGHIPPEWFEEPERCAVCYDCEKCFTGQD